MNEFHTLTDCEGVELKSNEPFRFACCDCGLVHDMVIVSQDEKPVGFAIKRIPEATAERRAQMAGGQDNTDYIGLALELESAAKRVESQTVERAIEAAAHGLRLAHSFRHAPGTPPASAQDDAQDERQAFEAWAKGKKMPLARIGEQYDDFWVDHAWNGWQARAALAAQVPQQGEA